MLLLGKWDEELMSGKDGEELEVVCEYLLGMVWESL